MYFWKRAMENLDLAMVGSHSMPAEHLIERQIGFGCSLGVVSASHPKDTKCNHVLTNNKELQSTS